MAQTDREALVALYNATGGAAWKNKRKWNTWWAALSRWKGVEVDTQGRVVKLVLTQNLLQGPMPLKLGALRELKELSLSHNELTGPIPSELGALRKLKELCLSHNQLKGPIPKELGALSKLESLRLNNNQLTGPIPPELGSLGALKELSLGGNKLSGRIPPELGNLSALRELFLYNNQLRDSIPEELGVLTKLQALSLTGNQLTGHIPPELGNLGALRELYLYGNQLRGHIPAQLGDLGALKYLYLNNNKLDGHIPPELGNLSALRELHLYNNQLRGTIPAELGKLIALTELHLDGNNLSGGPRPNESILAWKTRLQAELAERERAERERAELERAELERAERERIERERAERERAGRERAELERAERERAKRECIERERAERERVERERIERERVERERIERERAEEHARMEGERQRAKEFERQEMVRKAGDVGLWLHQDLGFDDDNSVIFGANLSTRHLYNPKAIFAMDQRTLEAVLRDVEMPELLASLVMEAWHRSRKEDEDRRRAEAETALVAARERPESAAEERRRRDEEEHNKKQLREAEAEAERQRLEAAAREERARRLQQALLTPLGRWLQMEAHFDDTQASRFCAALKELGLSSTQALKVQDEAEQQQLALELKMNRFEARMFLKAMETLRSKPDVFDVPSSTANAGASFVNLVQLRDCGGMATVFSANQRIGGPESTATRPVVLKRSDKDQPAAYLRESRVLQYLSRPGGAAAGFVIQLLEAYSTPEYNYIAMEKGGQNLTALVKESKRLPVSERKTDLALWGQQACQVLVALHGLGVVWGDVKPDNFVLRRDRLVAVDFGSACVEVGSTAQLQLGADADTSFTSSPSDQFAWSVEYAAPERAMNGRLGSNRCVARRSQDVWSLGMVLYFISTKGTPYFPSPVEQTKVAIDQFRGRVQETLAKDEFCVDLRSVRGSAWRCSLGLALQRSVDERGTASEVLEALTRGIHGLGSTIRQTRGMESLQRTLAAIEENQQEVLRGTGTISGNVERVLQQLLGVRRQVLAISTVLEHLVMDEMRMPHTFLILPEKRSKFRRPKQWFTDRGRLHFLCAHGLELVPCGKDGTGFLVSRPKEWMKKHATLLRVTVMTILAAAAVAGTAASGGVMGPIAASLALPFEVMDLDEAYRFLSGVGGEEMDRMLDDISDTLDPTKGEMGVRTNFQSVKDVTGAEYRSVLNFLDTRCRGWDRQMGGMERTLSADGVHGWVCPQHRSEWRASHVQGASTKERRASGSAPGPVC